MLCHYAVADITGANPNVFYELGIRHAMRPRSTVIVFAEGTVLPFDIALRARHRLQDRRRRRAGRRRNDARTDRRSAPIAARGNPHDDSPIFQLVEGVPRCEIDHTKTDIFRKRGRLFQALQGPLARGGEGRSDAVKKVADDPALSNLLEVESGVVVDLFLSLARREGPRRHDRALQAHAAAVAARQDDARAARLRAQSRRPLRGSRESAD